MAGFSIRVVCAGVMAAGLAGCGAPGAFSPAGTGAVAGSASVARGAVPDAAATRLFVIDATASNVDVYDTNGKLQYVVKGPSGSEAQSVTTDAKGALYVAYPTESAIAVFAQPQKGKFVSLADPGNYPVGVAVAPKTQLIAVTNILSTSGGAGSVSFYEPAKTTACANVSNPTGFERVYFAAFDATGDLFVDGVNSAGATAVGEIVGGCAAHQIAPLTLGGTVIAFPGGVGVNTKDEVVIGDSAANTLYTFSQPKNGSLGKPVATTTLSGGGAGEFAFTANGADIWTAPGTPGVAEYAYPGGGAPLKTLSVGNGGIAVTPTEIP